jgi:hypothetical protein
MKEFRKPKMFIPNLDQLCDDMKTLLCTGHNVLTNVPEEHHKKICTDFLYVSAAIKELPEESETTSTFLPIFKRNLLASYLTLVKFSEYTLDVIDFLDEYQKDFREQKESGIPQLYSLMESFGMLRTILDDETDIQRLEDIMALSFMDNYMRSRFPEIHARLNNQNQS